MMLEAVAERTAVRNLLMHGFHFYVSIMCAPGINDTQCGFKLLTRPAAERTFPHLHLAGWAYDVELLFLAQQLGLGVTSAQVPWRDVAGSKVRLETPLQMAIDVARVRLLYAAGVWRLPRRDASSPQPQRAELMSAPEYVEEDDPGTAWS